MLLSSSQNTPRSRKRAADAMKDEAERSPTSSSVVRAVKSNAMDLDVYEEGKDELGAWVNGEDPPAREEGLLSVVASESAEAEVPSVAAAAHAEVREPSSAG